MNSKKDMERRIYGTKVNIDTEKTRNLYNERGKKINSMKSMYTAVLLGDQNPEYADKWDEIEKREVLPYLNLTAEDSVLDLGCGIGRWAEEVMPICKNYVGVDFSDGMINCAKQRCSEYIDENKKFICCSVQDYLNNSYYSNINIFIVSYVCMYINDEDMIKCFEKILEKASLKCVIYFIDTIALNDRLTLNEIYSEALKADYSALYRNIEEYEKAFEVFYNAGFRKTKEGFMPKLNGEANFSETDRHYTILIKE